ncbi:hypothetical protein C7M84_018778 [Penaeus vannamei]|uniref:Uncharacterized protein n=1 Tax=Penaeus vannamei TaxID=6689 RepID=A0A3R7PEM9_PENVA|nr:hypothetical protein C7M84_018778 [Penaeus vannamei]
MLIILSSPSFSSHFITILILITPHHPHADHTSSPPSCSSHFTTLIFITRPSPSCSYIFITTLMLTTLHHPMFITYYLVSFSSSYSSHFTTLIFITLHAHPFIITLMLIPLHHPHFHHTSSPTSYSSHFINLILITPHHPHAHHFITTLMLITLHHSIFITLMLIILSSPPFSSHFIPTHMLITLHHPHFHPTSSPPSCSSYITTLIFHHASHPHFHPRSTTLIFITRTHTCNLSARVTNPHYHHAHHPHHTSSRHAHHFYHHRLISSHFTPPHAHHTSPPSFSSRVTTLINTSSRHAHHFIITLIFITRHHPHHTSSRPRHHFIITLNFHSPPSSHFITPTLIILSSPSFSSRAPPSSHFITPLLIILSSPSFSSHFITPSCSSHLTTLFYHHTLITFITPTLIILSSPSFSSRAPPSSHFITPTLHHFIITSFHHGTTLITFITPTLIILSSPSFSSRTSTILSVSPQPTITSTAGFVYRASRVSLGPGFSETPLGRYSSSVGDLRRGGGELEGEVVIELDDEPRKASSTSIAAVSTSSLSRVNHRVKGRGGPSEDLVLDIHDEDPKTTARVARAAKYSRGKVKRNVEEEITLALDDDDGADSALANQNLRHNSIPNIVVSQNADDEPFDPDLSRVCEDYDEDIIIEDLRTGNRSYVVDPRKPKGLGGRVKDRLFPNRHLPKKKKMNRAQKVEKYVDSLVVEDEMGRVTPVFEREEDLTHDDFEQKRKDLLQRKPKNFIEGEEEIIALDFPSTSGSQMPSTAAEERRKGGPRKGGDKRSAMRLEGIEEEVIERSSVVEAPTRPETILSPEGYEDYIGDALEDDYPELAGTTDAALDNQQLQIQQQLIQQQQEQEEQLALEEEERQAQLMYEEYQRQQAEPTGPLSGVAESRGLKRYGSSCDISRFEQGDGGGYDRSNDFNGNVEAFGRTSKVGGTGSGAFVAGKLAMFEKVNEEEYQRFVECQEVRRRVFRPPRKSGEYIEKFYSPQVIDNVDARATERGRSLRYYDDEYDSFDNPRSQASPTPERSPTPDRTYSPAVRAASARAHTEYITTNSDSKSLLSGCSSNVYASPCKAPRSPSPIFSVHRLCKPSPFSIRPSSYDLSSSFPRLPCTLSFLFLSPSFSFPPPCLGLLSSSLARYILCSLPLFSFIPLCSLGSCLVLSFCVSLLPTSSFSPPSSSSFLFSFLILFLLFLLLLLPSSLSFSLSHSFPSLSLPPTSVFSSLSLPPYLSPSSSPPLSPNLSLFFRFFLLPYADRSFTKVKTLQTSSSRRFIVTIPHLPSLQSPPLSSHLHPFYVTFHLHPSTFPLSIPPPSPHSRPLPTFPPLPSTIPSPTFPPLHLHPPPPPSPPTPSPSPHHPPPPHPPPDFDPSPSPLQRHLQPGSSAGHSSPSPSPPPHFPLPNPPSPHHPPPPLPHHPPTFPLSSNPPPPSSTSPLPPPHLPSLSQSPPAHHPPPPSQPLPHHPSSLSPRTLSPALTKRTCTIQASVQQVIRQSLPPPPSHHPPIPHNHPSIPPPPQHSPAKPHHLFQSPPPPPTIPLSFLDPLPALCRPAHTGFPPAGHSSAAYSNSSRKRAVSEEPLKPSGAIR